MPLLLKAFADTEVRADADPGPALAVANPTVVDQEAEADHPPITDLAILEALVSLLLLWLQALSLLLEIRKKLLLTEEADQDLDEDPLLVVDLGRLPACHTWRTTRTLRTHETPSTAIHVRPQLVLSARLQLPCSSDTEARAEDVLIQNHLTASSKVYRLLQQVLVRQLSRICTRRTKPSEKQKTLSGMKIVGRDLDLPDQGAEGEMILSTRTHLDRLHTAIPISCSTAMSPCTVTTTDKGTTAMHALRSLIITTITIAQWFLLLHPLQLSRPLTQHPLGIDQEVRAGRVV